MAKEYTKDTKKRFWDIIKKPKPTQTDLTVSAVDMQNKTITVTSSPNCPPNQTYLIPTNSGISATTLDNGSIITWTTDSTAGLPLFYGNAPMYTLTDNGETLELTQEEWNLSQKAAFDFIKKKRQYRDEFEDLINGKKS